MTARVQLSIFTWLSVVALLPALAQLPETEIVEPPANGNVGVGEVVHFAAQVPGGAGDETFIWTVYSPSNPAGTVIREPTIEVVFAESGVWRIECAAVNQTGEDPTPDLRVMTAGEAPDTIISFTPPGATVAEGTEVIFLGQTVAGTLADFHWELFPLLDNPSDLTRFEGPTFAYRFAVSGVFQVSCAAEDAFGMDESPADVLITVEAGADPPQTTVTPMTLQTVSVGDTLTFEAGLEAGNPADATYLWQLFEDEGAAPIDEMTGRVWTYSFNSEGGFTMKCTATLAGLPDPTPAEVPIQVNPVMTVEPQTTVTPMSPQTVSVGDTLTFEAGLVAGNPADATYLWQLFEDGGATPIDEMTGRVWAYTFNNEGGFTMKCAATLADVSDSTPAEVSIQVNPVITVEPQTTVTPMGHQTVSVGDTLTFEAGLVAGNPADATYLWQLFEDEGTTPIDEMTGRSWTYTFNNEGGFLLKCTATLDGLSDSTPAEVPIQVNPVMGGEPQTIIESPTGPQNLSLGDQVTFEAGLATGNPADATYLWQLFENGGATPIDEMTGRSWTLQFNSEGDFVMTCAATVGGVSDTSPAEVSIQVGSSSAGPETEIVEPIGNRNVSEGTLVAFRAEVANAAPGTAADFDWKLYRDGEPDPIFQSLDPSTDYTFSQEGSYTMTCAATVDGITDQTPAMRQITVTGAGSGSAPNTVIIEPAADVVAALNAVINFEADVEMSAAKSADITYRWELVPLAGMAPPRSFEGKRLEAVSFPEAGVFHMFCQAEDENGNLDPTPAMLSITIEAADPPETAIVSPQGEQHIFAEDSIPFLAEATNTSGLTPFFLWTVSEESGQVPPEEFEAHQPDLDILFEREGTFLVTCAARTATGQEDLTPATLRVFVAPRVGGVQTIIEEPANNLILNSGVSRDFRARVEPPDPSFDFLWVVNRSGASYMEETFTGAVVSLSFEEGIYFVRCQATLNGIPVDETPAERIVEVVENVSVRIIDPHVSNLEVNLGSEITFRGEVVGTDPSEACWYFEGDPEPRGCGLDFSHVFTEQGVRRLIFELPGGIPGETRDERHIDVLVDPLRVRILFPNQTNDSFQVNERFSLQAEVTGAGAATAQVDWIVGGKLYRGLDVEDVAVAEAVDLFIEVYAANEFGEDHAEVEVNIYDPGEALRAEIYEPRENLTVPPGELVFFEGGAEGLRGDEEIGTLWRIVKRAVAAKETYPVVRTELGNFQFNDPGTFEVTLEVSSDNRTATSPALVIDVKNATEIEIGDNSTLENAFLLGAGEFRDINLAGEAFFSFAVTGEVQNLTFELSSSAPVTAEILDPLIGEADPLRSEVLELDGSSYARSFVVEGLSQGTYVLHLIPSEAAKRDLTFNLSVGVLRPTLYFPDIKVDANYDTDLGIINSNNSSASLNLVGYDASGNILEKISKTISGKGKLASSICSLFADPTRIAWVGVDSDSSLNGYAHTRGLTGKESFATTATKHLESRLIVPHIAKDLGTWYTRSSVINGSAETANAVIATTGAEDIALKNASSFSMDGFDFQLRYSQNISTGPGWAIMEEKGTKLFLAGNEVFGTVDGTSQTAGLTLTDVGKPNPNFTYVSNNIYFTHIARDVANFWTGIVVVNVSEFTNNVILTGYGTGGVLLGNRTIELPANSKLVEPVTTLLEGIGSATTVDWLEVQADHPIIGYELFGTNDTQRLAGFEASSSLKKTLIFPYMSPRDDWHGISVINVNNQIANLTFSMYDSLGNVIATAMYVVQAHEKKSASLINLFSMTTLPANGSWVICESNLPVAGFELFGDKDTDQQMAALIAE